MIRRWLLSVVLAAATIGPVPISTAQSESSAYRDLAVGEDFRLRVAAAFTLAKLKAPNARAALEKALSDPHPAVRAAVASALAKLGDGRAVPALEAAASKESTDSVKAQIRTAINRLSGSSASAGKPKFLISLGKIDNRAGAGAASLVPVVKTTTRSRMSAVPGIELLADGADVATASKSRGIPAFTLDGSLTQLSKNQDGVDVGFSAKVEYVIRKMPEHALKGTMRGTARALADARSVRGPTELAQLQQDAVTAAIESAIKNVKPALEAAVH